MPIDADDIRDVMWRDVGLFRDRQGLERALARLDPAWQALDARLHSGDPIAAGEWRTVSILTVGRLIAAAALRREESRGGHHRSDFPKRDDVHWKRRLRETRTGGVKGESEDDGGGAEGREGRPRR